MRKQFVETVENIFPNDENLILLLCDIGVYGFRNSFKKYPNRIYNIGVLEQSTVSMSAGLSLNGFTPIIHTIAPFLIERSYEQIKIDLCYNNLKTNLVSVGNSFDYSGLGCTHHCPNDVMLINNLPNTNIFLPGNKLEFNHLFNKYYNSGKINYFRITENPNKLSTISFQEESIILKEGKKMTILVVGNLLDNVLDATSDLDVSLIYTNTVKPFDINILRRFRNSKFLIFEPYTQGALLNNILNSGFSFQKGLFNYGVPNEFIDKYGNYSEILKFIGLDTQSIRNKIIKHINNE